MPFKLEKGILNWNIKEKLVDAQRQLEVSLRSQSQRLWRNIEHQPNNSTANKIIEIRNDLAEDMATIHGPLIMKSALRRSILGTYNTECNQANCEECRRWDFLRNENSNMSIMNSSL